jgi:hypothetical protein
LISVALAPGRCVRLGDEFLRERMHTSHRLLAEMTAAILPLVMLILEHGRGYRRRKIPTTLARRSRSALTRSMAGLPGLFILRGEALSRAT